MAVTLGVNQLTALPQIGNNQRVGLLDPLARQVTASSAHLSVGLDCTQQGHAQGVAVALQLPLVGVVVIFTEGRGDVDDSSTCIQGDKVSVDNAPVRWALATIFELDLEVKQGGKGIEAWADLIKSTASKN